MWTYLSRLELKNSFFYYLFLLIFFFFWNFFSLFTVYLYNNLQKVANTYKSRLYLNMVVYSKDFKDINKLIKGLKKLNYIKRVEVFSPEKLFQKIKNTLPEKILKSYKKNELLRYFPYVVKVYPKSFKYYDMLKDQLQLLRSSNNNIDIYETKVSKLVNFAFALKPGFFFFFFVWISFYILFLLFLNYFLNTFLDKQIQVFLLLGGSLNNFKFLRLVFIFLFLSVGFILSTLVFYYISTNLANAFQIFEKPFYHLFSIFIYYIIIILVLPAIIIWFSYKKYET